MEQNITLEDLARHKQQSAPEPLPEATDLVPAEPQSLTPEMRQQVDKIKDNIDLLDTTAL